MSRSYGTVGTLRAPRYWAEFSDDNLQFQN